MPASHPHEDCRGISPIEDAIRCLQTIDPKWRVDIGVPPGSPEWIRGTDFACAKSGPFRSLLERIAERLRTSDRKTVAASFALRFGWSASVAIGPFLVHECVPDIALDNVSLKFRLDTVFERTAIHSPSGTLPRNHSGAAHLMIRTVDDAGALLQALRQQLWEQTLPVVEALYEWSGFSRKGAWGQITSSWASQFVDICERLGGQSRALAPIQSFFEGDDEITRMRPMLHPVAVGRTTHLYQRRASCCRYYLLPQGSLCASCPLVSQEERFGRNLEWMRKQLNRDGAAVETLKRRPSARLLVLDSAERVLLFRFVYEQGALAGEEYWATPGGALEPGESFEQAARRELLEETGIETSDVGTAVAAQEFVLPMPDGESVVAEERFFVVHSHDAAIRGQALTTIEKEVMKEFRWWLRSELAHPGQVVFPENLGTILESIGVREQS